MAFKTLHYFEINIAEIPVGHTIHFSGLMWMKMATFRAISDKGTRNTFGKLGKHHLACFVTVVSQTIIFLQ